MSSPISGRYVYGDIYYDYVLIRLIPLYERVKHYTYYHKENFIDLIFTLQIQTLTRELETPKRALYSWSIK